jgi:hypothetical protein
MHLGDQGLPVHRAALDRVMADGIVSLVDLPGLLVAGLGEETDDVVFNGLFDLGVEVEMPDPVEHLVDAGDDRSLTASLQTAFGRAEPVV